MKTLTKLSATPTELESPSEVVAHEVRNTQNQKGFWRMARASANGFYAESSTGGQVFLPLSEFWSLMETHDEKLKMPAPAVEPPT